MGSGGFRFGSGDGGEKEGQKGARQDPTFHAVYLRRAARCGNVSFLSRYTAQRRLSIPWTAPARFDRKRMVSNVPRVHSLPILSITLPQRSQNQKDDAPHN